MNHLHSIEEQLLDYLANLVALPSETDAATDLIAGGVLDSLTLVDLVLFIQSEFNVILGPVDVTPANFRCVAQLARLVHQRSLSSRQEAA
jgi:acyl carrier protein